jgi:TfoX/Sxy family transcriptional regulator of competence genes
MAFSQSLADRVRQALRNDRRIGEKKMFGGIAFLFNGNMLVGVWEQSLVVRLGPDQATTALKQPHVQQFDVGGRPMKGWIMVEPDGLDSDQQLAHWIDKAVQFVETLPPK